MCVDLVQRDCDCDAAAAVNVNYRYLRSCSPFNANKLFVLFVHRVVVVVVIVVILLVVVGGFSHIYGSSLCVIFKYFCKYFPREKKVMPRPRYTPATPPSRLCKLIQHKVHLMHNRNAFAIVIKIRIKTHSDCLPECDCDCERECYSFN